MGHSDTKVYLIGGPPGAGKSTLGLALGARLGVASISVDDLVIAAHAITIYETHPGLHAKWGSTIVIDGWHMRPRMVAQLELDNVWSGWIVPSDSVLEERESRTVEFVRKSSNPKRMLEDFLARNLWFNDLIRREATELHMNILPQPRETSVDELCQMVLDSSGG